MRLEIKGTRAMRRRLLNVKGNLAKEAERALREEGEEIMTRSKRDFVPVDFGNLRASGHVDEVKRTGNMVSVSLNYGGPSEPYALIQHEGDFRHRVGTRKYLEKPMMAAVPGMPQRIAERMRPS